MIKKSGVFVYMLSRRVWSSLGGKKNNIQRGKF